MVGFRHKFPSASIPPKMHMLEDHAVEWVKQRLVRFGLTGSRVNPRTVQQPRSHVCVSAKRRSKVEEHREGAFARNRPQQCRCSSSTSQEKKEGGHWRVAFTSTVSCLYMPPSLMKVALSLGTTVNLQYTPATVHAFTSYDNINF